MQGLFGWPKDAVKHLFEGVDGNAGDAGPGASMFKGLRLVTTSDFSGMGTAELAVHMVMDAVREHFAQGRLQYILCRSAYTCLVFSLAYINFLDMS